MRTACQDAVTWGAMRWDRNASGWDASRQDMAGRGATRRGGVAAGWSVAWFAWIPRGGSTGGVGRWLRWSRLVSGRVCSG